jgi:S-adenosylmethionine:tRNA ribosyltransferase-isomerase
VAPEPRGSSRLMCLDRATAKTSVTTMESFAERLEPGDLLVVNNTKVVPARLFGRRVPGGGLVECVLLGRSDDGLWEALVHPGQRLRPGRRIIFERDGVKVEGEIVAERFHGRRSLRFHAAAGVDLEDALERLGHAPLPPYIHRPDTDTDRARYQTIFAREKGAVAAPTAGLHFTHEILAQVAHRGVDIAELTLHVGYGTFKPVRSDVVEAHTVDAERYEISPAAAARINRQIDEDGRIIAVGTTTTRALEDATQRGSGRVLTGRASADLFIYPGHRFRAITGLLTNFHLPRSSLLMLVCAFAGRELVLRAYQEAIALRFRFYSYGDAMLIL